MDTITCPTYFENCFTSDEIQEILNLQNVFELKQSKITSTHIIDYRISENFWIPKNNVKYKWIYDRLIKYISIANKNYKFNLSILNDDIQFAIYRSEKNGNYSWHDDMVKNEEFNTIRKLSLSVQLSNEHDYEGGELEIVNAPNNFIAPKKIGTIIVFPSFLIHRVTPVTKGNRISLVLWIDGPPFK